MNNRQEPQSILSSAGENYEYIRTIINNKIEIKKLEILSKGASIGSSIITIIGILILFVLIVQLLLGAAIAALYQWTGSLISALFIMIGILLLLSFVLFLLRRPLIQHYLEKKIENNFIQKEEETDTAEDFTDIKQLNENPTSTTNPVTAG